MKKLQFKSIEARLTFWFVIVAMLPLHVAVVIIYNQAVDSRKESVYNKLEIVRNLKVIEIDNWIDERVGDIRTIAEAPHFRSLGSTYKSINTNRQDVIKDITEARDCLKSYLQHYNSFYEIFLISPDTNKILVSSIKNNESRDCSNDPYLTGALQNRGLFIKDIYFSKTVKRPCMAFSIPVYDLSDSSSIIGILVAKIDLDKSLYRLLLNRTGLGKTGETLLVNRAGVALNELRWMENAPFNLKISARPAAEAALGKTGIVETKDYRGEMVLAAYTHIPRTGWGFVAKLDLEEVYAPIYKSRKYLYAIGNITLFSALILAFIIAKALAKPITRLKKGAEIIGGGNLSYKVGTDSQDEVGSLSRAFDKMIENVKNISSANTDLTNQISEHKRTKPNNPRPTTSI